MRLSEYENSIDCSSSNYLKCETKFGAFKSKLNLLYVLNICQKTKANFPSIRFNYYSECTQ